MKYSSLTITFISILIIGSYALDTLSENKFYTLQLANDLTTYYKYDTPFTSRKFRLSSTQLSLWQLIKEGQYWKMQNLNMAYGGVLYDRNYKNIVGFSETFSEGFTLDITANSDHFCIRDVNKNTYLTQNTTESYLQLAYVNPSLCDSPEKRFLFKEIPQLNLQPGDYKFHYPDGILLLDSSDYPRFRKNKDYTWTIATSTQYGFQTYAFKPKDRNGISLDLISYAAAKLDTTQVVYPWVVVEHPFDSSKILTVNYVSAYYLESGYQSTKGNRFVTNSKSMGTFEALFTPPPTINPGCYLISTTHNSDQLYLSNTDNSQVELSTKISVWTSETTTYPAFTLISQSTDGRLSAHSPTSPTIQTIFQDTFSAEEEWIVEEDGPYCFKISSASKYLSFTTSGTYQYSITFTDSCVTRFNFQDLANISIQASSPITYHLKVKDSNKYFDNYDDVQINYLEEGDLWEFSPNPLQSCALTIKTLESQNSFIESYFNSENFSAGSLKMLGWYVLKGNQNDEVCLLNQKYGNIVVNNQRTITFPNTKTEVCDVGSIFHLTHPVTTNLQDGNYLIVSGTKNLYTYSTSTVKGGSTQTVWEIKVYLGITVTIYNVSLNKYLNYSNGNISLSSYVDEWHIIAKANGKHCIQNAEERKYVTIESNGNVSAVDDCLEGEFEFVSQ